MEPVRAGESTRVMAAGRRKSNLDCHYWITDSFSISDMP